MLAARGHPFVMPVIFGQSVLGFVRSRGYGSDEVAFIPSPYRNPERWLAAGITSYDTFVAAATANPAQRLPLAFFKNSSSSSTAYNWFDSWPCNGIPPLGSTSNTAFTAVALDDTVQGGLPHGGNVSTKIKSIVHWLCAPNAGGAHICMLVDRVLVYDQCTWNSASNKVLTQTGTAGRYVTSADSAMQIALVVTAASGATAANLTQLRYTDNLGNALHSMATSRTVSTIVSVSAPSTSRGSRVFAPCDSGATQPWGAFLPLASGDQGARLVNDYTLSASNTGSFTIALVRPLAYIAITQSANCYNQDDLMAGVNSLPRVYDGACLNFWEYAIDANGGGINGSLDVAWSA